MGAESNMLGRLRQVLSPRPRRYPSTYQLEVFAGCNLRCPLCHAGREEIERDARVLSLDQFKHVWDKIEPYAEQFYLHVWGEPTLNKHLISMVEHVSRRKPDCRTNVSTHGNGLSRDYAFRLVAAGLRQLIVSIDGHDQASYEKYRVGGTFADALSFLYWASEAKRELKSPIQITAQCISMAQTEGEKQRYDVMVGFEGVNVSHKPLYIGGYGKDYEKFLTSDVDVQVPTLVGCTYVTEVLTIQADGAIIPCCMYPEPAPGYDLGNIFESTVEELYERRDRREIDRLLRSDQAPTKYCDQACGKATTAVAEAAVANKKKSGSALHPAESLLRKRAS
jgi:radical SAM protein with 4Fe4S-binding SPASM domain